MISACGLPYSLFHAKKDLFDMIIFNRSTFFLFFFFACNMSFVQNNNDQNGISKGDCTLGELGTYICDEVAKQAVVTNGKEQTPVILTSDGVQDDWRNMKLR